MDTALVHGAGLIVRYIAGRIVIVTITPGVPRVVVRLNKSPEGPLRDQPSGAHADYQITFGNATSIISLGNNADYEPVVAKDLTRHEA